MAIMEEAPSGGVPWEEMSSEEYQPKENDLLQLVNRLQEYL